MTTSFWDKYKVFILGLIGAIALSLNELLTQPQQDWKVYGYAALMAALSYIAMEWRGKNVSITGIIGTLAGVFVTLQTTGTFSVFQFIVSAILAVLAAVSPPPKPVTYEHSPEIVKAKELPPIEQVEDDSKLPVGAIHKK